VLLVIIAGYAAGLYAFRARKQVAESAATESQPVESSQPANNSPPTGNQTEPGKINEVKVEGAKTESKVQRAPTRKNEAQPKNNTVQAPQSPDTVVPGHDPNRDRDRDREREQRDREQRDRDRSGQPPPSDPMRPPGNPPGYPRGLPDVRTYPNGSKVIKQPDGTYIFVGPKGQTRIIPPPRPRNSNVNHP